MPVQWSRGLLIAVACSAVGLIALSKLSGQDVLGAFEMWLRGRVTRDDAFAISRALTLCLFLWTLKACLAAWYAFVKRIPVMREVPPAAVPLLGGGDLIVAAAAAAIYASLRVASSEMHGTAAAVAGTVVPAILHCGVVAFSTVSWQVNRVYGWPLDIRHIRAADDLRTMGSSLRAYAGIAPIALLVFGVVLYPTLGGLLERFILSADWLDVRWRLWLAFLGSAAVLGTAWAWQLRGVYAHGLKKNAVIHFVQYYTRPTRPPEPEAFRRAFSDVADRHHELTRPHSLHLDSANVARDYVLPSAANGLNLLLILLESTPAEYLDPVTTPNLHRLADRGLSFTNHFTVVSETYRAVYALLYSDYLTDLGAHPRQLYGARLPQQSLAEVLQAREYRTAFHHSGPLGYAGLDYFLDGKGFDTLVGAREIRDAEMAWMWGVLEEQTVESLTRWIDGCGHQPFFAVYSTMFPHHPYYCPLPSKPFPNSSWTHRFRNSLFYADRSVGMLVDHLDRRGLRDNTLVVVAADHGQSVSSFPLGQGLGATSDEMRIPCILSNPKLFPARQVSSVYTNALDIAPTVSSLLGIPGSNEWLGRDLAANPLPSRLLFQAMPQSQLLSVIDHGLVYVLDGRASRGQLYGWHDGRLGDVDPADPRRALAPRYRETVRFFERWVTWRHLTRALMHAGSPAEQAREPQMQHFAVGPDSTA